MDTAAPEIVTRKGKIARLPARVRQQLNERLRDNESATQILPWVNGLPEARAILDRDFGGADISPQNLSEWRMGGFADWLRAEERVDKLRKLSEFSFKLAQASGGSIAEGAVAVAGGRILDILESAADEEVLGMTEAITFLRGVELKAETTKLQKLRLQQNDRKLNLDREKFDHQKLQLKEQIEALRKNLAAPDAPARLARLVEMIDAM